MFPRQVTARNATRFLCYDIQLFFERRIIEDHNLLPVISHVSIVSPTLTGHETRAAVCDEHAV
jgi:hypothetical protein